MIRLKERRVTKQSQIKKQNLSLISKHAKEKCAKLYF